VKVLFRENIIIIEPQDNRQKGIPIGVSFMVLRNHQKNAPLPIIGTAG